MNVCMKNIFCRFALVLAVSFTVSGCFSGFNNPAPTVYDLGPVTIVQENSSAEEVKDDMIIIPNIRARGIFNSKMIVYRLVYAQAYEPRTYAQSRWAADTTEMIRMQLQQVIGEKYPVTLTAELYESAKWVLWLSLEDFSQVFTTPDSSEGVIQIRCTLQHGNQIVGQRVFNARVPAPSPDAPGGVQALSQGVELVAFELFEWLDESITNKL